EHHYATSANTTTAAATDKAIMARTSKARTPIPVAVYRSAVTGQYVTKRYAKSHPTTTTREGITTPARRVGDVRYKGGGGALSVRPRQPIPPVDRLPPKKPGKK